MVNLKIFEKLPLESAYWKDYMEYTLLHGFLDCRFVCAVRSEVCLIWCGASVFGVLGRVLCLFFQIFKFCLAVILHVDGGCSLCQVGMVGIPTRHVALMCPFFCCSLRCFDLGCQKSPSSAGVRVVSWVSTQAESVWRRKSQLPFSPAQEVVGRFFERMREKENHKGLCSFLNVCCYLMGYYLWITEKKKGSILRTGFVQIVMFV